MSDVELTRSVSIQVKQRDHMFLRRLAYIEKNNVSAQLRAAVAFYLKHKEKVICTGEPDETS